MEEVTCAEQKCRQCGAEAAVIGYDESEQLDVEPARYFVRVTKREKRACRCCQAGTVTMPPLAPRIVERRMCQSVLPGEPEAISFRKGLRGHRRAGNVFVMSMLTVSAAGSYLGFMKSEMDNFTGGIFTFYLVATGWATAKRGENQTWKLDRMMPLIAVAFAATNIIWGIQISRGETAVKNQSPAGAYFLFGTSPC